MDSEADIVNLHYALDTFYILMCGTLVVWMAAGFTMLEAGLVRARNTVDILTKNAGLYAVACVTFALVGYRLAFGGGGGGGALPDSCFGSPPGGGGGGGGPAPGGGGGGEAASFPIPGSAAPPAARGRSGSGASSSGIPIWRSSSSRPPSRPRPCRSSPARWPSA